MQRLSWWIALILAHAAAAGEQKPIELSAVPDAILAITREKPPDTRLVSANTETKAIGSR